MYLFSASASFSHHHRVFDTDNNSQRIPRSSRNSVRLARTQTRTTRSSSSSLYLLLSNLYVTTGGKTEPQSSQMSQQFPRSLAIQRVASFVTKCSAVRSLTRSKRRRRKRREIFGTRKKKTKKKKKRLLSLLFLLLRRTKTVAGVAAVPPTEPKRIRRIALRIFWPLETHVHFHHLLNLLPLFFVIDSFVTHL